MNTRQQRAVIILNGNPPIVSNEAPLPTNRCIICVDGGTRWVMKAGITPDSIVGDFDSLPPNAKEFYQDKPVQWITHPPETDQYETDSELAMRIAKERGIKDCLIYGFSGGRLDHMTANLFLFTRYAQDMHITIVEPGQQLTFVTKSHEWEGKPGDIVSLIAMSNAVKGVTTDNLHYPLVDFTLKPGSTLGVSNVMKGSRASVSIRSGVLLVVHSPHVIASETKQSRDPFGIATAPMSIGTSR